MSLLSWLRQRKDRHRLSQDVIDAQARLTAVTRDDQIVTNALSRRRDIVRKNHLGPLIAEALRQQGNKK